MLFIFTDGRLPRVFDGKLVRSGYLCEREAWTQLPMITSNQTLPQTNRMNGIFPRQLLISPDCILFLGY